MNIGRTIFAQVMDYVPMRRLDACVKRYYGGKHIRTLS